MKRYVTLLVCLVWGLLVGCEENLSDNGGNQNLDLELVNTLNTIGVENAIITQHTLYPYHFVPNGEELNELGQRDLQVLAHHFRDRAGGLSVRRGETAAELYEARITHVIGVLKDSGVDTSRIQVSDAMPGGSGMPSERVVTILKEPAKGSSAQTTSYSGTITR